MNLTTFPKQSPIDSLFLFPLYRSQSEDSFEFLSETLEFSVSTQDLRHSRAPIYGERLDQNQNQKRASGDSYSHRVRVLVFLRSKVCPIFNR